MTKTIPTLTLLLSLCGCSELDNCPEDDGEAQPAATEKPNTDIEALIYSSAPWDGPRTPFPGKVTLIFTHGLGTTPELVTSYVSFTSDSKSDVSENAGNQGRIRCVDDSEIWIKNDTCEEDFFVRVVAQASGSTQTECSCAARNAGDCEP